ncbi:MAG: chromosome partitioning protein ParB, partial [Armatimonadetes bacterium]|nr:chromosome partitioning protein ParB [Armatimonadota bacterium]
ANTMRLLHLPPEIRSSLVEGKITEGHARALLGIHDPAIREQTWQGLVQKGGSVRAAETAARRSRGGTGAAAETRTAVTRTPERRDPHIQDVEARLRRTLGTKVEIVQGRGGKGVVTIEFYDEEDLNRILDGLGCG